MTYHIITFRCKECMEIVKVLIRDNHALTFSIMDKLHSENQCLTTHRFFICVLCGTIDNNKRFEIVYN